MSNGDRKAVGWSENDIRHIAEEVSQVSKNPLGGGMDMKDVWKWLVGVLVALILGGMVTALTDAQSARAEAEAAKKIAEDNAAKKISKERALEKFAPVVVVEIIKKDIDFIKLEQAKQDKKLDDILKAVQKRR